MMSAPPQLLIVEDDPLVGRAVARALRDAGYEVHVASSASETHRLTHVVEVAVIDIDLGDGSGLDLAEALLAAGRVGRVVFHSATRDPALVHRARRMGTLVEKTTDTIALLEAVAEALGARE